MVNLASRVRGVAGFLKGESHMSHPGHLHDKNVNIHAVFYLKWHFLYEQWARGEGQAYKIAAYM